MRVFRFLHDSPVKASCCNGRASVTYWMAESREEAEDEIAENTPEDRIDHGICAVCLAELLVENGHFIQKDRPESFGFGVFNTHKNTFVHKLDMDQPEIFSEDEAVEHYRETAEGMEKDSHLRIAEVQLAEEVEDSMQ